MGYDGKGKDVEKKIEQKIIKKTIERPVFVDVEVKRPFFTV